MMFLILACAQNDKATFDTSAEDTAAPPPETTVQPGEVLVSEVMFDPSFVDGDVGEWIELRNLTDASLDLEGVVLQDGDGAGFLVEGSLLVDPGGFVVLGPSGDTATNGGAPIDYAYSIDAVKLGNEGDTLTLVAGGVRLDTFTWDATVFTVAEGSALQLSAAVEDPDANDAAEAWCLATAPYGAGDLGTPGATNGACG